MTPDSPTLYEVLGVCPDATDDQIKSAWRVAAKTTHPDAGGTDEEFRAARHAWEVLSDPGQRAAYDATLAQDQTVSADDHDTAADAPKPDPTGGTSHNAPAGDTSASNAPGPDPAGDAPSSSSAEDDLGGEDLVDPVAQWPWCASLLEATPRLTRVRPSTLAGVIVAVAGCMGAVAWHELLEAVGVYPGFIESTWVGSVPAVAAVAWIVAVVGVAPIRTSVFWLGWGLIGTACVWGQPWAVTVVAAGWLAWMGGALWWWHRRVAWSAAQLRAGNLYDLPPDEPAWQEPVEWLAELIPSVRAVWSPDGQTVAVVAGRRVATLGLPIADWPGATMRGWNPVGADTPWIVDQVGSWLADQDKPLTVDGYLVSDVWSRLQRVRQP